MRAGRQRRPWAVWAIITTVATVGGAAAAAREEAVLAVAYGNGVHAYYAGDYHRSHEQLTAAIEGGTRDPRAFYFRGLAALKLGRLDEAEADFSSGADREAAEVGDWPVARSLERVQGEPRLQLERHRVRARLVAMEQRRQAVLRRYTAIEAAQPDVQRTRRPETAPAAPAGKKPVEDEPTVAPVENEGSATDEAADAEPMAEEEPADSPASSDDPF